MKVLQINILYKEKSTGRTCFEVNRALKNCGHEGFVAYGKGMHSDKNTYRIGSEIEYYAHNILARITGLQGYYSFFATKRLIKYIKNISPDIIHLRNLHESYLNLPLMFAFLKKSNIPVIQNLHDCWVFTGKCSHYTDIHCYKWKTECFKCPLKRNYLQSYFFERSNKLFTDKKKWFNGIRNLTIIGVSNWTSKQAKMSFLSSRRIETIYNWIDRDVFYPRKKNVFNSYGVNSSKFIILGLSASWLAGSPRYEDFIKLSTLIPNDMQIVLIGESKIVKFPKNIKHIQYIANTKELAKLYSSADVYVHLSTEDTFGKVIAEAMACGTPAVVYDSTAIPELVEEGCGYIVRKRDIVGIFEAISKIRNNGKNYYSKKCVYNVTKNYDYKKNIMKLIKLYQSINF